MSENENSISFLKNFFYGHSLYLKVQMNSPVPFGENKNKEDQYEFEARLQKMPGDYAFWTAGGLGANGL